MTTPPIHRRGFLHASLGLSLAGATAAMAQPSGTTSKADPSWEKNDVIQAARQVALDILKPSKKDLEHGLELHADSLVFEAYGFAPRAAVDGDAIRQAYGPGGDREFDAEMMERAYQRPCEVAVSDLAAVPGSRESLSSLGGHLDGCRIGFDLGASDYKLAAINEGEPVFSTEIPWNPKEEPDPDYHYQRIREASSRRPRTCRGSTPSAAARPGSSWTTR